MPHTDRQMNIVMLGHVDHGKSTVIGRLLADTNSLPEGKLEQVRANCAKGSRPFEYAFLLDALKDEQAQGITIDSARCFFKSDKRRYVIIDAPGHIEFLKNMITGAARAEAAVLVIDAEEGVRENSRRHGYLLSMLGIKQIAVCVNKMDIVNYDKGVYEKIVSEYSEFLERIGLHPACFIAASGRHGDSIAQRMENMPWYTGPTVLEALDNFENNPEDTAQPFRFPVQDIYKFTAAGDARRIAAGRVETGQISAGDEVVFLPSEKKSKIKTIEGFNTPEQQTASAGQSTGFTFSEQVYIKPGELMCKAGQPKPILSSRFKANIFWLGRHPMIPGKRYKMKLSGTRVPVWLADINTVLDASELTTDSNRHQIERHDVAECVLETLKPVAFDLAADIAQTGRFVIIDNYEIAGGGIILEDIISPASRITEHVQRREKNWQRSSLTTGMRAGRYGQRSAVVIITGPAGAGKNTLAKALEANLFNHGRLVYYLGLSNSLLGADDDISRLGQRDVQLSRLGEIAHMFTDAGVILITTVSDLDDYELEMVKQLNQPNECVVINVGASRFTREQVDLQTDDIADKDVAIKKIKKLLQDKNYLIEYYV